MSQNFSIFGWILSKQKMDLLMLSTITSLIVSNKDGAGHILLVDQKNPNTIHVAMRGSEEFLADWLRSDTGNIAIGDVPMHQFVNHLNDLSIHVTVICPRFDGHLLT